jgi:predicted GTPase
MKPHPLIAVIGHPNEGKSSVLSTLLEDDSVRVSDTPGETVVCQSFPFTIDGLTLLELVDTPGFQNPRNLLAWMQQNGQTDAPLLDAVFQAFEGEVRYHHDLELMRPLREGAAVIYVVDASRPLLDVDLAEMEILRLINRPRMAVINFKEDDHRFLDDWKQAFRRHFNVVREFSAHRARFADRIALLETLKAIQQDWEAPLNRAIAACERDWDYRRDRAVEEIVQYLKWALTYQASRSYTRESDEAHLRTELLEAYRQRITKEEQRLFKEIRRLYRHHVYDFKLPGQSILQEDLFSERTWQVLGLTQKQLILAAAFTGAGAGVALDLALSGLSFGIFTATGAALGGGGALFKGKELSKLKVHRLPVGGFSLTYGPSTNPQFPFILLDRVLVYYREIMHHAHGKREGEPVAGSGDRYASASFARDEIKELTHLFRQLASSSFNDNEAAQLALREVLWKIIM